jgi:hypothetical protein
MKQLLEWQGMRESEKGDENNNTGQEVGENLIN